MNQAHLLLFQKYYLHDFRKTNTQIFMANQIFIDEGFDEF